MGAGYHGGFGNTAGENKHKNNVDTIKKSKGKYLANFGTIDSNAKAMSSIYPMKNGYFGVRGKTIELYIVKINIKRLLIFI